MTIKSQAIGLIALGVVIFPIGLVMAFEHASAIGGVCAAVAVVCVLINLRHM